MEITLKNPLDMHLHLRDNDLLKDVLPYTTQNFSGAIVMPNLLPSLTTKELILDYKNKIMSMTNKNEFKPFMTLFYDATTTKEKLLELKDIITAVKLYPSGVTTNSESGLASIDIDSMSETLELMSELGLPLLIHGETNGFVLDREKEFLPVFEDLAKNFPKLKIMIEHISSKESIDMLEKYDNLYATITVHHMMFTLDDLIGGSIKPHLFCKPVVKLPKDRDAILSVATKAHPKVMFGSDSAPHLVNTKERDSGNAGVFSSAVALPLLCEIFEKHNALDNLQAFVSDNAFKIYNVTAPNKEIKLIKKEMTVPAMYNNVVPICANEKISWSKVI
jgi:dihydroorotase